MKTNKEEAGHTFNICAQLSKTLGILLAPICPTAFRSIMNVINIDKPIHEIVWEDASKYELKAGGVIDTPIPVFQKFKLEDMLEQFRRSRDSKGLPFTLPDTLSGLEQKTTPSLNVPKESDREEGYISYKFFQQFQFKTARIKDVEEISQLDKDQKKEHLQKFILSIGKEFPYQVLYARTGKTIEQLHKYIGKDVVYLANLENLPSLAKITKDQKSIVLYAAENSQSMVLIIVDKIVRLGSKIR